MGRADGEGGWTHLLWQGFSVTLRRPARPKRRPDAAPGSSPAEPPRSPYGKAFSRTECAVGRSREAWSAPLGGGGRRVSEPGASAWPPSVRWALGGTILGGPVCLLLDVIAPLVRIGPPASSGAVGRPPPRKGSTDRGP